MSHSSLISTVAFSLFKVCLWSCCFHYLHFEVVLVAVEQIKLMMINKTLSLFIVVRHFCAHAFPARSFSMVGCQELVIGLVWFVMHRKSILYLTGIVENSKACLDTIVHNRGVNNFRLRDVSTLLSLMASTVDELRAGKYVKKIHKKPLLWQTYFTILVKKTFWAQNVAQKFWATFRQTLDNLTKHHPLSQFSDKDGIFSLQVSEI